MRPDSVQYWCEYAFRTLRTLVNPADPFEEGDIRPVTLTTTKRQEVPSYSRPKFDGEIAKLVMNVARMKYPDLIGPVGMQSVLHELNVLQFVRHSRKFIKDEMLALKRPGTMSPFYRAEPIQMKKKLGNLGPSIGYVFGSLSSQVQCEKNSFDGLRCRWLWWRTECSKSCWRVMDI